MKCQYCGFELPEDSQFCYNCGKKLEGEQAVNDGGPGVYVAEDSVSADVEASSEGLFETADGEVKYCPFCGGVNEADAVFCCACGQNMNGEEGPVNEENGKKDIKKPVMIAGVAVAAVFVIFAVVKIFGAVFGGGGSDEEKYITYIKDDQIMNVEIDSRKAEPLEYKGSLGDDYSMSDLYGAVQYSKDGKYMCYPSNYDESTFRLNMIRLGKGPSEAVKIENDVTRYTLLDNNKILYIKSGSDTLYINDIKGNKEKIASDVYYYFIDKAQKNVFWAEYDEDDGTFDMYYCDINLKNDDTKLMAGYTSFIQLRDKELMAFVEDDTLYVVENLGEKEKIDKDVSYIIGGSDDSDGFYYITTETETLNAADFVDDDMKAADAAMEEPNSDNYVKEDVQKNSEGRYEKTEVTDWDAYYAAWDEYELKEDRDCMREALAETTFDIEVNTLHYYKDGETVVIDENFAGTSAREEDLLVYSHYVMEDMPKIKLSELTDIYYIQDEYESKRAESKSNCVSDAGKVTDYGWEEWVSNCNIDTEKGIGYGLTEYDEEDDTYTLVSFDLKGGELTEVNNEVSSIEALINGNIYYLVDAKDYHGDLYCNDEEIDSDVYEDSVTRIEDSDTIIYAVDYNDEKRRYTLKMYAGKESKEVADDVTMFAVYSEDRIALLIDYNTNRGEGDLVLYNGKAELKEIDSDVRYIMGGSSY